MAITKIIGSIHPTPGNAYAGLGRAIDYISNRKKTGDGLYLESQNCFLDAALKEMVQTAIQYGKEPRKPNDRLGYHFSISWSPEEDITPEQALSITRKFCQKYLAGFEAVFSVHLDQKHIHSHIVFHSVNAITGRKYRYDKNDWERIVQPLTDRLCREEGLHTLEEDTGIPLPEYKEERQRNGRRKKTADEEKRRSHSNNKYYKETTQDFSNKSSIRFDIDQAVAEAKDLEDFRRIMKEQFGYQLRIGKSEKYGSYTAFFSEGMERWRRNYALGADYTDQAIEQRISMKKDGLPKFQKEEGAVFIFPASVYHIRIRRRPQHPFLCAKYAELYRMGILPKSAPRLSYREKQKQLEKLRKLETELSLLSDLDFSNPKSLEEKLQETLDKKNAAQKELSQFQKEYGIYNRMIKAYRRLEKMEYSMELEPADKQAEQMAEYKLCKEKCDSFPFSFEELKGWQKTYRKEAGRLKKKIAVSENECQTLKNAQKEFLEEAFARKDELEDEMLAYMDEQYSKEVERGGKAQKEDGKEIEGGNYHGKGRV